MPSHPIGMATHCALHGLSHPGIRATQKLITACFVWPDINADVCRWTRSCVQCQCAKIQRHSTGLASFRTPNARFDVIHLDLVGPLPPSHGYTYLLTCVHCFTSLPEAIPLTSITAETVSSLSQWLNHLFWCPTIVTDRGHQFKSQSVLMTLLGSRWARSMAYHPQTNGMVECFHRQLKAALKPKPQPHLWTGALPLVLSIHTALKEDMVYGTLCLPPENFSPLRK